MKMCDHNNLVLLNVLCVYVTVMAAISVHVHAAFDQNARKAYIVYMGEAPPRISAHAIVHEHNNLLYDAIGDEEIAKESRIHSYGRSFNGFAARLLPHEAKRLSEKKGVVSVFLNTKQKLHTTRSWDFLRMPVTLKQRNLKVESDLIVGMIDTGIWIGSPSFNDKGYGPPPQNGKANALRASISPAAISTKVIGATYYNFDYGDVVEDPTPADSDGHGTHTASTAAGNRVKGASVYGLARGMARGGVPSARIAVYKVCWNTGCTDMDLLAGLDDAIADGVDILSISIGGPSRPFFEDPMAIGSFHAMRKGILTSCSAGNSGPYESSVQNVAPWIMTVAASTIDRQFKTGIKLGDGFKTYGVSINTFSPRKTMYPLTNGAQAGNFSEPAYGNISACEYGTLSIEKVAGKIIYCIGSNGQDYTIRDLRGAGTIISSSETMENALSLLIPGTYVNARVGRRIDQYINSTRNAQAVIYKSITVTRKAPSIASFSSRGPQIISRNILKPDLTAPGVDILAAYSRMASLTGQNGDLRFPLFNVISGTSMSCPHAAGAAAYVKTIHPDWSPAAIKSALMTTATPMMIKQKDAELGSGSGQIDPVRAAHPGLIYDISISAYIRFLCKEGYNTTAIGLVTGFTNKFKCSDFEPAQGTDGLNYPYMHVQLKTPDSTISAVFYRTVTNVGSRHAVYNAYVTAPKGLTVQVVPETLTFNKLHQKRSFKVVLKGGPIESGTQILSALLEWRDSMKHSVKSPILVYKPLSVNENERSL